MEFKTPDRDTKASREGTEWCIYSHLKKEEKNIINKIVYDCLKRNGFDPEDPWWEMNYLLPSEDY